MKETIQVASGVITITYFILSCLQMFEGIRDRIKDQGASEIRRIEVVAPGYRVGWWLGGPLYRKQQNKPK